MPEGPVLIMDVTRSQDWGKNKAGTDKKNQPNTQPCAESLGVMLSRRCRRRFLRDSLRSPLDHDQGRGSLR